MKNKVSFPRYGKYTDLLVKFFKDIGSDVLTPPPITKRTIELGTKYSPGDICYPFKVTLGTLIEAVEQGADTIIQINSAGWCLLRCYPVVQEQIMRDLGFSFRMINLNVRHPMKMFNGIRKMAPGTSFLKIVKKFIKMYKEAKRMDTAEMAVNEDSDLKIGVIGEVYVCNENAVNLDIVDKLHAMGIRVDRWLSLSNNLDLLGRDLLHLKDMYKCRKKARKYFPERIGGHANENLVNLIGYAEQGFDGVILLKPFACNPETIIEPAVEVISRDYNIPVLSLTVDESMLETHFQTRIESFIDMLKMRRGEL